MVFNFSETRVSLHVVTFVGLAWYWYCATVVSTAENWSETAFRDREYNSQSQGHDPNILPPNQASWAEEQEEEQESKINRKVEAES